MREAKKWRELSGDASPRSAAKRAIAERGAVLSRSVRAAGKLAVSVETIHDMRIACRRFEAALTLFSSLFPRQTVGWLLRKLPKLRQSAGKVRDLDLLLAQQKPSSHPPAALVGHWQKRRSKRAARTRELAKQLCRRDKLKNKLKQLREKPRGKTTKKDAAPTYRDWIVRQLRPLIRRFLLAAERAGASERRLHELRIIGKQLRYTLELAAPVLPATAKKLQPLLGGLQDRLGLVCDHRAAAEHLRKLAGKKTVRAGAPVWRDLLAKETSLQRQSKQRFLKWRTAARRRTIAALCQRLLDN